MKDALLVSSWKLEEVSNPWVSWRPGGQGGGGFGSPVKVTNGKSKSRDEEWQRELMQHDG